MAGYGEISEMRLCQAHRRRVLLRSARAANLPGLGPGASFPFVAKGERRVSEIRDTDLEDAGAARQAAERLLGLCYDDLKRLARSQRRIAGQRPDLLTTDLLHECYLKIRSKTDWTDRAHFMRTAALAMRQIVIDHARAYSAQKRAGDMPEAEVREIAGWFSSVNENPEEILVVGDLMEKLWTMSGRAARVVECRYFAGFTEEETASALSVSERTIRRDWAWARAWILAEGGFSRADSPARGAKATAPV